jgi:hypothetical protein
MLIRAGTNLRLDFQFQLGRSRHGQQENERRKYEKVFCSVTLALCMSASSLGADVVGHSVKAASKETYKAAKVSAKDTAKAAKAVVKFLF